MPGGREQHRGVERRPARARPTAGAGGRAARRTTGSVSRISSEVIAMSLRSVETRSLASSSHERRLAQPRRRTRALPRRAARGRAADVGVAAAQRRPRRVERRPDLRRRGVVAASTRCGTSASRGGCSARWRRRWRTRRCARRSSRIRTATTGGATRRSRLASRSLRSRRATARCTPRRRRGSSTAWPRPPPRCATCPAAWERSRGEPTRRCPRSTGAACSCGTRIARSPTGRRSTSEAAASASSTSARPTPPPTRSSTSRTRESCSPQTSSSSA